jgi:IMP cyclohydrolase
MDTNSLLALARKNLDELSDNPYPGRGIVVGMDVTGQFLVMIYWIMGRSEGSRNRIFNSENGRLFTEAADPAKMKDPSLIIYNAMREKVITAGKGQGFYVVSNGDQTDTVFENLSALIHPHYTPLCICLNDRIYEPDKPNFTSRITAVAHLGANKLHVEFSILRKSEWGDQCDRMLYRYDKIANGLGLCITTYSWDGNPLPPFKGDPILLPIEGGIGKVTDRFWDVLNPDNRVSLAVKFVSLVTGKSQVKILNKYQKV